MIPDGGFHWSFPTASPGDLERMESFRRDFVDWFAEETGGVGSIDTALPGVPVIADFEAEVFAGPPPLAVSFRDRSTGPTTGRLWDFGDGHTSTETDPVHVYDDPGFYSVSLTAYGPGAPQIRLRPHLVLVQPFVELVHDDFEVASGGWLPTAPDDAVAGHWVRAQLVPTSYRGVPVQAGADATPDPGSLCWVTGNADPGASAGDNDVDGGATAFRSSSYDLSGAILPVVEYSLWLSNDTGGGPGNDPLQLQVSPNGGVTWIPLDATRRSDRLWRTRQVRLTDSSLPTAGVRFRFVVADAGLPPFVEAAIDEFRVISLAGFPDGDGDAIPDAIDNCPALPNEKQLDRDLDGHGTSCDCDDADPAAGQFPGSGMVVESDPSDPGLFIWSPDPVAVTYNVYKGILSAGEPLGYVHHCMKAHTAATQVPDPTLPPPGGYFYYLVSGENLCGEAGLGLASDGTPRPLDTPCPPPIGP